MKNAIIFALILTTGCTVQAPPQTPADTQAKEESPCLDAMKASAGAAYDATKEKIKESSKDGLIKDAGDKLDELKDRAGKAYDVFMEE